MTEAEKRDVRDAIAQARTAGIGGNFGDSTYTTQSSRLAKCCERLAAENEALRARVQELEAWVRATDGWREDAMPESIQGSEAKHD